MAKGERFHYVGRRTGRHDGYSKASGKTLFTSDIYLPGMLYGRILT